MTCDLLIGYSNCKIDFIGELDLTNKIRLANILAGSGIVFHSIFSGFGTIIFLAICSLVIDYLKSP